MSNALAKHDALLCQHKFVLVRDDKHKVYRNPEGKVYVTAATPSDWRAGFNMLKALKRCIAEPAKPLVLAINDFERSEEHTSELQSHSDLVCRLLLEKKKKKKKNKTN